MGRVLVMDVRDGQAGMEVVKLPAEIDVANAAGVADQLCAAIASGAAVVIADLTDTMFCDSSGLRGLLLALRAAVAHNAELRLAAPRHNVLRVLQLSGIDQKLRTYPTLAAAVAQAPPPA